MILSDLILPTRAYQRWLYSGMDSLELCRDKKHFLEYPYPVVYEYNSRGFRDAEWPLLLTELKQCIWCVGDSFTLGNGQPLEHTWPRVLQNLTGRRCINVSMDGASNDWIFRRICDIVSAIKPKNIVIMWSYTSRRELDNPDLIDEDRRIWASKHSWSKDTRHWIDLSNKTHNIDASIIQSTIPGFDYIINECLRQHWNDVKADSWPPCPCTLNDLEDLPISIKEELKFMHGCYTTMESYLSEIGNHDQVVAAAKSALHSDIIYLDKNIDWARDHHHFDILTSRWLVDKILVRLDSA